MVLRCHKIVLGAVILAVYCNCGAVSMDWRERSAENEDLEEFREDVDPDKMRCANSVTGFCKTINKELPDSLVNYFAKRKSNFASASNPHRCSCQMVNQMMDLGRSYYPRILENWVCKNDSCGPRHRCVEKKYSVRVLKLKDLLDTDADTPMCFSPNLKGAWVPEVYRVGVACECVL